MAKSKRIGQLEIYRWIFILLICIFHFGNDTQHFIIKASYIGVEYFFVIAGFYLARSLKNSKKSAFQYTVAKMKKLFPVYSFSIIVVWLYNVVLTFLQGEGLHAFIKFGIFSAFQSVLELSMFQMLGFFSSPINGPLWYVSALIIVSYFVWYFYKKDKERFLNVLAPIIICVTVAVLSSADRGLDFHRTTRQLFIYDGIWRAFLDVTVGILSFHLFEKVKESDYYKKVRYLQFIECLFLFYIGFHICFLDHTSYDFLALGVIALLVVIANLEVTPLSKILNVLYERFFSQFDPNYIFMVYASNVFMLSFYHTFIWDYFRLPFYIHVILFTVLSLIISYLFLLFVNFSKKIFCK